MPFSLSDKLTVNGWPAVIVTVPSTCQLAPSAVNEAGAAFWFTTRSVPPLILYGALLARLLCGVHVADTWYVPASRTPNDHAAVSRVPSVYEVLNRRSLP